MGLLLMGLSIPYEAIIAYALGLVLLYVVGYLLLVPFKMVLRFIYNGLLGGLMLWGLNVVGGFFGVNIAINFVTADHPIADLTDDLIKKRRCPPGHLFFQRYFSMGSMKNRQMGTIKRIISLPSRIMQKKHEKGRRGMQDSWA